MKLYMSGIQHGLTINDIRRKRHMIAVGTHIVRSDETGHTMVWLQRTPVQHGQAPFQLSIEEFNSAILAMR